MYHNRPQNSGQVFGPFSSDELLPSFQDDDTFDFPIVSTSRTAPSGITSPAGDYENSIPSAADNKFLSLDHGLYSTHFMPKTDDNMPFGYIISMQPTDAAMRLDSPMSPSANDQLVSQDNPHIELTDGKPEDIKAYAECNTSESSNYAPSDEFQSQDLQGQNLSQITWTDQYLPDSSFIPFASPPNRKYRFIDETAHYTRQHTPSTNLDLEASSNGATARGERKSQEEAQQARLFTGPHVTGVSLNGFRAAKVSNFHYEGTRTEGGWMTLQPRSNTYTLRKRGDPSTGSRNKTVAKSRGRHSMTYSGRWSHEITVPAPVRNPSDEELQFTKVEFEKSETGTGNLRKPDYLYSFFKAAHRFKYQHSGIVQFESPAEKEYRVGIPCTVDTPQYGKIEDCTYTVILELSDPDSTD